MTEGLLKEMRDEVNQKGAKFVLVVGSNPIQVHPNRGVRERFQSYVGAGDLFYPNQRLARFAGREQIDFIDLAAQMQVYADEKKVFLHGFDKEIGNGHWNPDGHRVAAEMIAEEFCQGRVARPGPSTFISRSKNPSTGLRSDVSYLPARR